MKLSDEFLQLSRRIGSDPLLVQGPGGNTSCKIDGEMWIKASGTELADADNRDIFVAVDPSRALLELDGAGDGSCRSALVDPDGALRPSIETTFHAMFSETFVFHFHSVATICHAICPEGRQIMSDKLSGLSWIAAPYRKPGIPLSKAIRNAVGDRSVSVVVLENHGVIVMADTVGCVNDLISDLEDRLRLPAQSLSGTVDVFSDVNGWQCIPEAQPLAMDGRLTRLATSGSYYPDHVVFLGPGLPISSDVPHSTDEIRFPAVLVPQRGVYLKPDATPSQRAMVVCLADVLTRIPEEWNPVPIGVEEESVLLNWDAEKYRQELARRGLA